MASHKLIPYEQILKKKLEQKQFYQLRPFLTEAHQKKYPGDGVLNFSDADIFQLSAHPFIKKSAIQSILKWGSGSTCARPLTSHIEKQIEIETLFSSYIQRDRAKVFHALTSPHQWILPALIHPRCSLFIEKHLFARCKHALPNHKGRIYVFDRRHLTDLEISISDIAGEGGSSILIAAETVSSYTGEILNIPQLEQIASDYDVLLYLDDSSAFGIKGARGEGLIKGKSSVDIAVYHFYNTLGLPICAVSPSPFFGEFFYHCVPCPTESSPLPPSLLGTFGACLQLLPDLNNEREHIHKLSQHLRVKLIKGGFDIGKSESHIIPIISKRPDASTELSQYLSQNNILASYQSVQNGKCLEKMIRFTINKEHNLKSLDHLANLLATWAS